MRMHAVLPLFLALAAMTGCGGTNLASTVCGDFTPCGGSVPGKWAVTGSCPVGDPQQSVCPGLTTDSTDVKFGGTVTFNPNMTYTLTRSISGTGRASIPKTCLTAAAGPLVANASCEVIASFAGAALAAEGAPISKFKCTTTGANCNCEMTFTGASIAQAGTYQSSGNTLVLTHQGGVETEAERWDYCSDDTNMRMKPAAAAGGRLDLESTLSGVLVLKKQ